ncbi:phage protease [Herbaspirillum sp.]|uniref:phage protease n=1 Tax=Herbaspirillum sp. TaxID=1890675 RepID=UPI001B0C4195|nr:phage protease [Herbaspirillum sp.]MBO9538758.1 hypothetical protein [Herbaspirillum sp.]
MSQIKTVHTAIAALAFELGVGADGQVTTEAHLLPAGEFRSMDGRPEDCDAWRLDADIASRVIALAASRKNDILIDFEHQSLYAQKNGKRVEAAGWIPRTLEWREGAGLYGTNISWVGDTAQLILDKKVRYVSSVFSYDASTGAVLELLSVTLTNTPGLDGLEALVALARENFFSPTHEKEAEMADEKQVAALTVERDTLNTKVAALTAERDGLAVNVAALTKERDELKVAVDGHAKEKAEAALASEKAKKETLIDDAKKAGQLIPAQEEFAKSLPLAELTRFLDTLKPVALLTRQAEGHGGSGTGLSDTEIAYCTRMGVSHEDYLAAKKAG